MNDEATEDRADDLSWTKRASALKRAFWWSGLTLLSAAPLSFLDRDEVLSFFAVFPVPLNALDAGSGHEGPTSPLQVLEEKRLMVTLMVGLVLWGVCAVLSFAVFVSRDATTLARPSAETILRRAAVSTVSSVLTVITLLDIIVCHLFIYSRN
jgi:hypothetical protein